MKLPDDFLRQMEGLPGYDREAFADVHDQSSPPVSIRLNPAKPARPETPEAQPDRSPLSRVAAPVPWCRYGYYLSERPSFTFDPLFHAGCYYVQEASSMFLEQALRQCLDLSQPLKALDLCAAPGGKSTHVLSLLSPDSLLVSNEVIKPRSLVLADNVVRWGAANAFVSNNDPKAFSGLHGFFDLLVVDAPCSGSGLFRKDAAAVDEWSLQNVALCAQRQRRILADALPALKESGLLVYSTCSYSAEEDEAVADWLVEECGLQSVPLDVAAFGGIVPTVAPLSGAAGYRFYPDKVRGEGFFLACFRKPFAQTATRLRPAKPDLLSAKETSALNGWVQAEGLSFVRFRDAVHAVPERLLNEFSALQAVLNLRYAGVRLGELMRGRLVPHHALALSKILSSDVPSTELDLGDAVRYLQRQALAAAPGKNGWQTVRHQGQNLGWINALANRVNNYYPKEIRILKQHNNTAFEN